MNSNISITNRKSLNLFDKLKPYTLKEERKAVINKILTPEAITTGTDENFHSTLWTLYDLNANFLSNPQHPTKDDYQSFFTQVSQIIKGNNKNIGDLLAPLHPHLIQIHSIAYQAMRFATIISYIETTLNNNTKKNNIIQYPYNKRESRNSFYFNNNNSDNDNVKNSRQSSQYFSCSDDQKFLSFSSDTHLNTNVVHQSSEQNHNLIEEQPNSHHITNLFANHMNKALEFTPVQLTLTDQINGKTHFQQFFFNFLSMVANISDVKILENSDLDKIYEILKQFLKHSGLHYPHPDQSKQKKIDDVMSELIKILDIPVIKDYRNLFIKRLIITYQYFYFENKQEIATDINQYLSDMDNRGTISTQTQRTSEQLQNHERTAQAPKKMITILYDIPELYNRLSWKYQIALSALTKLPGYLLDKELAIKLKAII